MQRIFTIGDQWIYFKIYTGVKTSDIILSEVIKPLSEKLINENIIDKWFFIRYFDPKPHLRIRFFHTSPENLLKVIFYFNDSINQLLKENLIWKIQTDTYQRELERYGNETIEYAETVFFHDSAMIINMLDMIEGEEGELYRWLFSLRATDELLNNFNFSINEKYELITNLYENFGKDFNKDKNLTVQLDNKFRKERSVINNVLDRTKDNDNEMLPLFDLLSKKSEAIQPIINVLLTQNDENKLSVKLNDLFASYSHMSLNRIFRTNQRLHEFVIYFFLHKYYKSEIGKIVTIHPYKFTAAI